MPEPGAGNLYARRIERDAYRLFGDVRKTLGGVAKWKDGTYLDGAMETRYAATGDWYCPATRRKRERA